MTIMTVIRSKLSNNANNNHILTTPHKDTTFTGGSKNKTVLTVINIDICGDIEDKISPIFASINIELLPLYRVDRLDPELIFLLFEVVILWVECFLLYF